MCRKTIDLTMRLQTYLFISFPKCGYSEARFPFNLKFTFPEWPSSESPNPACVCVCARACMCVQLLQSCPTLCDPKDCSLPGSSVYGIFQARLLEWVAMLSSRGSSRPGIEPASPVLPALQVNSLPTGPPRKPT